MKRLYSLFLILLFGGGCAQPPLTELAAARAALAEAYSAGANSLAAEDYQVANRTVQDCEALIREGNYQEARQLLPQATQSARRAQALARAADIQLRQTETEHRHQAPTHPQRLQTRPLLPPSPSSPPLPKPAVTPLSSYIVGDGETLWTIAAQPRVYNDPLLWQLLYKANRDQIRDPRRVYSGQVLSVPRELSPTEVDEARQEARSSDIFPVNPEIPIPPATVPR